MIALEHEYESCTCTGGMRNGERCPDCRGRGLVKRRPQEEATAAPEPEGEVKLEALNKADLQSIAESLGLDTKGTKAELVERIAAARDAAPEPEGEVDPDGDPDEDAGDADSDEDPGTDETP